MLWTLLRRLKLQGQNLPKSASLRHSEKIVLLADPKTQQQKIKQKSVYTFCPENDKVMRETSRNGQHRNNI